MGLECQLIFNKAQGRSLSSSPVRLLLMGVFELGSALEKEQLYWKVLEI